MHLPPEEFPLHIKNVYGGRKKIIFIIKRIREKCLREKKTAELLSVLDVGCGTGVMTEQIAHTGARCTGIDTDEKSIEFAKGRNTLPNLTFLCGDIKELKEKFDFVISLEVMEHLRDPVEFLQNLKERVKEDGEIIISVPNGYGAFELENFLYQKLKMGIVLNLVERIIYKIKQFLLKMGFLRKIREYDSTLSTLNPSPHLHRFTWMKLLNIFNCANLRVIEAKGTTLLGGPITHFFFRFNNFFINLNEKLGDIFPKFCSNGWIIALSHKK